MATDFEWDGDKAASNLRKHGVGFEEAATAFFDPLSVTINDPLRSEGEQRAVLIGQSSSGRLLVAVHTVLEFDLSVRDWPHGRNDDTVKKQIDRDLLPEYDFTGGIRGKYVSRLAMGSNIAVLDRDVQELFPNSVAVNAALREREQVI